MATSATETIKSGDSNITAAVREFWDNTLQEKIYERVLSRNLPGAVNIIQRYGQGIDKTYRWTRSLGITTTTSSRYDVATSDLEMKQVEYGTEEKSVTADHKAGFVAEKVDILRDQEGFVMPDIMDSLARDLAVKEDNMFISVLSSNATVDIASASAVDISLVELRKPVTKIEENDLEGLYMLMSPQTIQTFADEMDDASFTGDTDNAFLRRNVVGQLWGLTVVKSNKIPDDEVYYLGEDAIRMFERAPYTLTMNRDNITDLYVKFAVEARFGFGADRVDGIRKAEFSGN